VFQTPTWMVFGIGAWTSTCACIVFVIGDPLGPVGFATLACP